MSLLLHVCRTASTLFFVPLPLVRVLAAPSLCEEQRMFVPYQAVSHTNTSVVSPLSSSCSIPSSPTTPHHSNVEAGSSLCTGILRWKLPFGRSLDAMETFSGFILVLSLNATCMLWLSRGPLGFLERFLLLINEYSTAFEDFCEFFGKCWFCGVCLPPPSCVFALNLLDSVVLPVSFGSLDVFCEMFSFLGVSLTKAMAFSWSF